MSLRKIRREFRDLKYEFTIHALEEMEEDNLRLEDVRWAILHGAINAQLTDDPRGAGLSFVARLKTISERSMLCAGFRGYYV
jgi:hypothetical protein